jgi:hypothetical protein
MQEKAARGKSQKARCYAQRWLYRHTATRRVTHWNCIDESEVEALDFETLVPGSGLKLVVKHKWELDYDIPLDFLDYLGSFSDKPQNKYGHSVIDRKHTRHYDRNSLRYFVWCDTLESRREGYTKLGYSRHEAHANARREMHEDWKRLETYGSEWGMSCASVHVYLDGIELARDSLSGIEDDSGRDEALQVLTDCREAALTEALVFIGRLAVDHNRACDLIRQLLDSWDDRRVELTATLAVNH